MLSIELLFGTLIVIYLMLMWKAGKSYPILFLFLFLYFLQYIFSTYLIYNNYAIMEDQMVISQVTYFEYAVPAILFLFLGVLVFARKDYDFRQLLPKIDPVQASQLGYLLLAFSFGLDLLEFIGLGFLGSVTSFTGFFKYIAAFCFLFSNSKFNYFIIFLVYVQLALSAVMTGVFITFFIWSTYLFFFIFLKFQIPFVFRALFIVVVLPVLFAIQSVKHDYRKQTWSGRSEGGLSLYSELFQKNRAQEANKSLAKSSGVVNTIGRLTQGWHLGLTLKEVPKYQPIAHGEEMVGDVIASILPRVIFSDKKSVNSQEKFEKYTGHRLRGNTSMSIGILGDFYINFGRIGSFIGLFIFGALVAWSYRFFIRKYVVSDPINIVFVPFILTYLVRANNDFYIFFNGMVKGFILFLIINYLRTQLFANKKVPQPRTTLPSPAHLN